MNPKQREAIKAKLAMTDISHNEQGGTDSMPIGSKEYFSDDEADELEERFARNEREWLERVRDTFEDWGIKAQVFKDYLKLRDEFEKEALSGLDDFHDNQEQKKGANYKYQINDFDNEVMDRLRKKYYEKLSDLIGQERLKEFLRKRDEFNEELKQSFKGIKSDDLIDF
ncbi:MAG: hypothetical protein ACPGJV_09475 [Bacteriovoracaceae bacterium]